MLVDWYDRGHEAAGRLVEHARRNYGTDLRITYSKRPWGEWPSSDDIQPGILWHADFRMRDRTHDVRQLWQDPTFLLDPDGVTHVRADDPWHLGLTFSAAERADFVSDSIGTAFEALLVNSRPGMVDHQHERRWELRAEDLDFRVKVGSGWNVVGPDTLPVSVFATGRLTEVCPPL